MTRWAGYTWPMTRGAGMVLLAVVAAIGCAKASDEGEAKRIPALPPPM